MSDTWSIVHTERRALVEDLSRLTDAQWEHPSLCAGWSVHDVAAHLVDNALATPVGVVRAMVRAGFDFDRQNDRGVRRQRGATPSETLERLDRVVGRTSGPPAPLDSRLVEEVLHGEDIRRPLGIHHEYSPEAVLRSLRYQARTPGALGGGKDVARQVGLHATDADFSTSDGPEVAGPALSLLMAISGRTVALEDLHGPGVAVLR
ncbi:maleylpyruvate isomerase family mycothiol-dependent enzyme [Raoultella terrigena]|uniref:maleylpyruvate isomerase family mycothiol-dependent enzyme n=1 Tax=Raoultella terrigena TaxID=577 RepID=UPI00132F6885